MKAKGPKFIKKQKQKLATQIITQRYYYRISTLFLIISF